MRIVDNPLLSAGLLVGILMLFCYATGRLHQWYLTTTERELAFRDGYDAATKSLFSLATRARNLVKQSAPIRGAATVMSLPSETKTVDVLKPAAPPRRTARHSAERVEEEAGLERTRVWTDRLSA